MTEWAITFTVLAHFVWGAVAYFLWGRLQSRGQALRICHDAMREYEERIRHYEQVAKVQGSELDRTTAQLTHALGGDTEGGEA